MNSSHFSPIFQNPIFYILGEHPLETKEAVAKLKQNFPNAAIVLSGEYLQEMQVTDESLFIGKFFQTSWAEGQTKDGFIH